MAETEDQEPDMEQLFAEQEAWVRSPDTDGQKVAAEIQAALVLRNIASGFPVDGLDAQAGNDTAMVIVDELAKLTPAILAAVTGTARENRPYRLGDESWLFLTKQAASRKALAAARTPKGMGIESLKPYLEAKLALKNRGDVAIALKGSRSPVETRAAVGVIKEGVEAPHGDEQKWNAVVDAALDRLADKLIAVFDAYGFQGVVSHASMMPVATSDLNRRSILFVVPFIKAPAGAGKEFVAELCSRFGYVDVESGPALAVSELIVRDDSASPG